MAQRTTAAPFDRVDPSVLLIRHAFGSAAGRRFLYRAYQTKEAWSRPMGPGDLLRDEGERAPTPTAPLKSLLGDQNLVDLSTPVPDQSGAGSQLEDRKSVV